MTLVAHIDEYACAAHGDCVREAPLAFAVEDIAVVTGTAGDEALLRAARACPSGAIALTDAETDEEVYP
jgi:ferredoxin